MNKIIWLEQEKKLRDTLLMLRSDFGCESLKVSTEDAGMSFREVREVYRLFNDIMPIVMKIGGPEARNDIVNAVEIGVAGIVGPMIETEYSLEKYIETLLEVAGQIKFEKLSKHINIETVESCRNIEVILHSESAKQLNQVTVGRSDLSRSMKKKCDDAEVMELTKEVTKKCRQKKIIVSVGGNITPRNAEKIAAFVEPDKINTREVGFTLKKCRDIYRTVEEALKFEQQLIEHKIELFNFQIQTLSTRRQKIIKRLDS